MVNLVKKHFNSLSKTQTQYYKINVEFNDGKWSSTQKGAFPYTNEGLAESIKFYNDSGLDNNYKIFATDGTVVYPKYQDTTIEQLNEEIDRLKDDVEVYERKCAEYRDTIKEYKNILSEISQTISTVK